jgi:hypothetical protein
MYMKLIYRFLITIARIGPFYATEELIPTPRFYNAILTDTVAVKYGTLTNDAGNTKKTIRNIFNQYA